MEYPGEDVREAFLDLMDIFQGEFALIELAFKKYVVDDPVHQR